MGYDFNTYLKLFVSTIIPVIMSIAVFLLLKIPRIQKINYWAKQIIIGILFGIVAIFATEKGVAVTLATLNVRDAAPLCAGLIFGGPAGVIAGVIGGVERFFASYWGAGTYTQIACSVSTIIAGILGAVLRKFIFENKRPSFLGGFCIGVIMEAFHLTMVFLTHLSEPDGAITVVKACLYPMLICTGITIGLAILIINILDHKNNVNLKKDQITITKKIQIGMLVLVVVAFIVTSSLVYVIQSNASYSTYSNVISQNIRDVKANIIAVSNNNLLRKTETITDEIISMQIDDPSTDDYSEEQKIEYLYHLAAKYDVLEINVVDKNGIIKYSNKYRNIGYDMADSQETGVFNCLLKDKDVYVQTTRENTSDEPNKFAGQRIEDNGYVHVGYNTISNSDDIQQDIQNAVTTRHIGDDGFLIVCDGNFNIVANERGHEGDNLSVTGLTIDPKHYNSKTSVANIYEKDSLYSYSPVESYYVIGIVPLTTVYSNRDNALTLNTLMELLVFAIIFILIYVLIKVVILNNIYKINDGLARIQKGNLNTKIKIDNTQEFIQLSTNINYSVDVLKEYIAQAKQRIAEELEFAKRIQLGSLPNIFPAYPNIPSFDLYATMNTAKEVGGDFYDFYMLGETRLVMLIADVSGKGIPAALFMMTAKAILKNLIESGMDIADAFNRANKELCETNNAEMFVTAWCGVLDLTSGHVYFVNAGHNKPLIYRQGKGYEYLQCKPGFVLTGMPGLVYKAQELDLNPGDRIYLYTDGVTEANNVEHELYGDDRLREYLTEHAEYNLVDTLKGVQTSLDEFVGEAEQFDDITMLITEYNGQPDKSKYFEEKEFEAKLEELDNVTGFIEAKLEELGASFKLITAFNVVIEEIFVNIAHYAYENHDGKAWVTFDYDEKHNDIWVKFLDEGITFDPIAKADPDVTLSADDRKIGGLGIYMVKKMMDHVHYERSNGENILTIKKKLDK